MWRFDVLSVLIINVQGTNVRRHSIEKEIKVEPAFYKSERPNSVFYGNKTKTLV